MQPKGWGQRERKQGKPEVRGRKYTLRWGTRGRRDSMWDGGGGAPELGKPRE